MKFTFESLRPEYEHLLAVSTVTRAAGAKARAVQLLSLKSHYAEVSEKTKTPVLWLMAIAERESSSDMRTYLGNGQSLSHVTTQVPRGRGPFPTWEAGAIDALHLLNIERVWPDWSWPRMLYEGEKWNGFGPRLHGRRTGYLWSGTDAYDGGKYIEDDVWSPTAHDPQLGIVPLMRALVELDPSLNLPDSSVSSDAPPQPPTPEPAEIEAVKWLQGALNKLDGAGLIADGSYGRITRLAVRGWQASHGLNVDGVAGPLTIAAIKQALNENT